MSYHTKNKFKYCGMCGIKIYSVSGKMHCNKCNQKRIHNLYKVNNKEKNIVTHTENYKFNDNQEYFRLKHEELKKKEKLNNLYKNIQKLSITK